MTLSPYRLKLTYFTFTLPYLTYLPTALSPFEQQTHNTTLHFILSCSQSADIVGDPLTCHFPHIVPFFKSLIIVRSRIAYWTLPVILVSGQFLRST